MALKAINAAVSAVLGTVAASALQVGQVWAQEAGDSSLDEIVVTATRQSDILNRVPLAVSAQTQRNLDQQGIRTINDLQSTVPSLRVTGQEGSGVATVAIRSIRQTAGTTATTGFYLDETPMQKRSSAGFGSQNGTPVPPLFDLERIEVLRGPQGTLFGGGSEGGTIRYIQPSPSLVDYSAYARAQWMSTRGGDDSYEGGLAFGGPLVEDRLGFRASVFRRDGGGYIDLTDYRDGSVYHENANDSDIRMGRIALAWAPSEQTLLTLSWFRSTDETQHLGSAYNLDIPGQLTVPSLCFDVAATTALPLRTPNRSNPVPFAAGPDCNGRAGEPGVFISPGYTVGPLDLKRFQSLVLGPSPTRTDLEVASLDFEWRIRQDLELRSITSYVHDLNRGRSPQNFHQAAFMNYRPAGGAVYVEPGMAPISIPGGVGFNPNLTASANGLGLGALLQTNTRNSRITASQEVRLASTGDSRVNYVVGAYYSNTRGDINQRAEASDEAFVQLTGMSIQQRFGVPFPGFYANLVESVKDVEVAAFGDVTVRLTDRWRLNGGVRVTHVNTTFSQTNYGPNAYTLTPSLLDGTLVSGEITDTPVTPKVSVQYFISPDDLVYLTAAKGFRAGGVNPVFSAAGQGVLFGQFGLSKDILPLTYESDSVWSYELGAKFRLWDGRAQINAAIYQLDWSNVQTSQFIGGDTVVFNVPDARSRGAEVEVQVRPVRALTLNAALAYSEAEYTSSLSFPGTRGLDLNIAQKGQEFVQPDWTADLGARLDFRIGELGDAYARLDYRWARGYALAPPGSPNYSPDSSEIPAMRNLNFRLGFERNGLDVNLFVLNLTDEDEGQLTGGRGQCTNVECSTFNTYNIARTIAPPTPRQVGVQIAYRR